MLVSMTAYARAEATREEITARVEVRSYNSRHLDVALRLPPEAMALETRIRRVVGGRLHRGRVEMRLGLTDQSPAAADYTIDWARAQALNACLNELNTRLELGDTVTLKTLLRAGDVLQPADRGGPADRFWPAIEAALSAALADVTAMREREGAFLQADLEQRLEVVQSRLERIRGIAADLVPVHHARLAERIRALVGETVDLDDGRIAQEAALLVDRSDISEEVVRAASHLAQFRDYLADDAPAGRNLNFLLQELVREFNTMGAKVGSAEAAHAIVAVKTELEKLKEQVQNVE